VQWDPEENKKFVSPYILKGTLLKRCIDCVLIIMLKTRLYVSQISVSTLQEKLKLGNKQYN
jgi:hypothetical protein